MQVIMVGLDQNGLPNDVFFDGNRVSNVRNVRVNVGRDGVCSVEFEILVDTLIIERTPVGE